jgi:hypothetical protein
MNIIIGDGSSLGSVHYQDGEFYTPDWNLLFTPLSRHEANIFLKTVGLAESTAKRRLHQKELEIIVRQVQSG